jgi:polysaccharide export outer membrane protein
MRLHMNDNPANGGWRRPTGLLAVLLLGWLLTSPVVADDTLDYRIQPGDALSITVWREKELSQDVLVRPDGGISFPLSGDLKAAGDTVEALRQRIAERLRRFIPDPEVSVAVRATSGNRIYVVGKVARPGEFVLTRPLDVMQSLGLAGGATPFAALDEIRILRREGDRQVTLRFRYGEVERGRNLGQNIQLQSGDTVIVP